LSAIPRHFVANISVLFLKDLGGARLTKGMNTSSLRRLAGTGPGLIEQSWPFFRQAALASMWLWAATRHGIVF
jgi:hypothetical protein